MVAGPGGILQPLADFIKLLTKEDIEPRDAKKIVFKFAPLAAFALMMFAVCFIPIDGESVLTTGNALGGFNGDLIIILAFATIANFFLFLAGWASSNPYGTIGSARVLTQFLRLRHPLVPYSLNTRFHRWQPPNSSHSPNPNNYALAVCNLGSMGFGTIHNHHASRT